MSEDFDYGKSSDRVNKLLDRISEAIEQEISETPDTVNFDVLVALTMAIIETMSRDHVIEQIARGFVNEAMDACFESLEDCQTKS